MSKANLCDICEKPIPVNTWSYKQYKVKMQYIKEENSNAGYFRKKEYLDVCPTCMSKFVEFANKERKV